MFRERLAVPVLLLIALVWIFVQLGMDFVL
ncbi:MAG: hypothetical protein ACI906_000553 [Candidatus Latescibacterota bacterium]|jgi:hypothetical protein